MASGLGFLYSFPANLGQGEWWRLSEEEAEGLADAIVGAVDAVPSAKRKRVEKALRVWAPVTTALAAIYATTVPRLMLTRATMTAAKPGPLNSPRGPMEALRDYPGGPFAA